MISYSCKIVFSNLSSRSIYLYYLLNKGSELMKKTIVFCIATIFLFSSLIPLSCADDCVWTPSDLFGDNFETWVGNFMTENHIPSLAFSVLNGTEVFYAASFGEQLGTDIAYHLNSAVKMFAGVAILQLYDQGLIDLDDNINNYLPYNLSNPHFPSTPITIKHLLSHRSGVVTYEDAQYTYWPFTRNGTYTFPQIIYEFLHVNGSIYSEDNWLDWEPGTNYAYSDTAFDILTIILSNVTSQPYFDYVEDNILTPLGMVNTHTSHEDYLPEDLAIGYYWNTSSGTNEVRPYVNNSMNPGGGGYYSSVDDMSKFMLAHMNNGMYDGTSILTPSSVELMHTEIAASKYGLAWQMRQKFNDRDYYGHYGGPHFGFLAGFFMRNSIGMILELNQEYYPTAEWSALFNKIEYNAHKLLTEKCPETPNSTTDVVFYLYPALIFSSSLAVIFRITRKKK